MHATRCSINATLENFPGYIVFNRDMFIDVPLIADLVTIKNRRQALVDKNIRRQNKKCQEHTYAIGQLVYMKTYDPTKIKEKLHGPYPIIQVYMNGTVDIHRAANVMDRVHLSPLHFTIFQVYIYGIYIYRERA